MNIKAITTHYNGYKFRSRLEARWAVFFDSLGIRYEYEPEGFTYKERLRNYVEWEGKPKPKPKTFYYLPDFYLPDYNVWVECKGGKMSNEESWKLVNFAASVGRGFSETADSEVFLAGDWFNNPDSLPVTMYFRKGELCIFPGHFPGSGDINPAHIGTTILACDEIAGEAYPEGEYHYNAYGNNCADLMLFEAPSPNLWPMRKGRGIDLAGSKVKQAYNKAKQARFEHGEKG